MSTAAMHKMGQRLKLRHKVTGVEKGPFLGWYPADWVKYYSTGEYDFIRSSDAFDKNGREIFAGDLLSVGDGPPFEVIENVEKVGMVFDDGGVQIETAVNPLRRDTVDKPISSFVAEAFGRAPEVAKFACSSVLETAAEKLVALTWRAGSELAGIA